MKIIIDIDEEELTEEEIAECIRIAEVNFSDVTILQKGHGDLVDADKVILGLVYGKHIDKAKCGEITKIFDNAVVIPADKGD